MKSIYILGSLNMDLTINGDRSPDPGETLPGRSFRTGAGGKGLNQAVAALSHEAYLVVAGLPLALKKAEHGRIQAD